MTKKYYLNRLAILFKLTQAILVLACYIPMAMEP